jgi:hypothetical protein
MSRRRRKRSKDNKTIYYYSLQQLQLDPDSGQWQLLKQQLGKRLLDWIDDKCRLITAEKKNNKRYCSNMLALKTKTN